MPRSDASKTLTQLQNRRGILLHFWCIPSSVDIVNKFVGDNIDSFWTFRNGGFRRQLDNCLIDKTYRDRAKSCTVRPDFDVGSDHRAIELVLRIEQRKRRQTNRRRARWPRDIDVQSYQQSLASRPYAEVRAEEDASSIAKVLEEQILNACADVSRKTTTKSCSKRQQEADTGNSSRKGDSAT